MTNIIHQSKINKIEYLGNFIIQNQNKSFIPSLKDSFNFRGKISCKQEIKNKHWTRIFVIFLSRVGKLWAGANDPNISVYNYDKEKDDFKFEKKLEGHSKDITCFIEMRKEDYILSLSDDKTIRQWCNKTLECRKVFTGHTDAILHLISLINDRIVSGSGDKTLKIWKSNGECLSTLNGHSNWVYCMLELKDRKMVSAGYDNYIKFWDLSIYKWQENYNISGVSCFTFTNTIYYIEKDDKLVVCEMTQIKIIDLIEYKVIKTISNLGKSLIYYILRLLDDSFIVGCNSGLIKFDIDLNYISKPRCPNGNDKYVLYSILYKGNMFITSDAYGSILIWEY